MGFLILAGFYGPSWKIIVPLILLILWVRVLSNQHTMMYSLIMLEASMLLNVMFILFTSVMGNLYMLFMTVSVCEAVLGLSLVVFISRFKSLDMMLMI